MHSSEVEGLELVRLRYGLITDKKKIGHVPFPRQIIEKFARDSVRVDAAGVDIGSVGTSMRSVEVTHGWMKPILDILIRYLKMGGAQIRVESVGRCNHCDGSNSMIVKR